MLRLEVKDVTKDKVAAALRKINEGEDAGYFNDELCVALAVILDNVTDAMIDAAWSEMQVDKTEG